MCHEVRAMVVGLIRNPIMARGRVVRLHNHLSKLCKARRDKVSKAGSCSEVRLENLGSSRGRGRGGSPYVSAAPPQYLVHVERVSHQCAVLITHPLNRRKATKDSPADAEVLR